MVKSLQNLLTATRGSIFTKLGMWHQGLLSIIVCSNNDPEVTLTNLYKNFPAKSKMAFLSRILILLAILLYEQYIHHTQASICPSMQFLSAQKYAYQSF